MLDSPPEPIEAPASQPADAQVEATQAQVEADEAGVEATEAAETPPRVVPDDVLTFLARQAPPRELWKWLNEDENVGLLHSLTRGFQRTPNALRQPIVRNRFIDHLRHETPDFERVLTLWSEANPDLLAAVRALSDEQLPDALPQLFYAHGLPALTLALMQENREAVLQTFDAASLPDIEAAPIEVPEANEAASPTALRRLPPVVPPSLQLLAQTTLPLERRLKAYKMALKAARETGRLEAQNHAAALNQETRRTQALQAELEEATRHLDRVTRKNRGLEKQVEETAGELKRAKRQLRQGQQLSEDLRRQLTTAQTQIENLQAALEAQVEAARRPSEHKRRPKTQWQPPRVQAHSPTSVAPESPLDQVFIWKSGTRVLRVSPREIKKQIEANNDAFIGDIAGALDDLRAINPSGFEVFMKRMRELDRYYARVLTGKSTRVLIDASNVARQEKDFAGKGKLQNLLMMRDELRRRDCFPILIYADASLPYNIDEPAELLRMVRRGEVQMSDSGQEADELLARESRRTGAYVVTNDRNFHLKVTPDFEPPRVGFRFHDNFLVVDEF